MNIKMVKKWYQANFLKNIMKNKQDGIWFMKKYIKDDYINFCFHIKVLFVKSFQYVADFNGDSECKVSVEF